MAIFIGLNIKYLCDKNSLTEKEFGDLFDQKGGTINTYTSGRSYPKPDVIQKICRHFGISIDDFFNVDMSKLGYQPNPDHLPLAQEPAAEYKTKDMIIAAQEKTIHALEKTIEVMERERSAGNLATGA